MSAVGLIGTSFQPFGISMKPLLFSLALLGGCAHYVHDCPPIVTYSPETSARLADELEALPPDSIIPGIVGDYMMERDQLRACQ